MTEGVNPTLPQCPGQTRTALVLSSVGVDRGQCRSASLAIAGAMSRGPPSCQLPFSVVSVPGLGFRYKTAEGEQAVKCLSNGGSTS